ncbi:MAG: type I DNA topoisomerase [Thalassobaculales bacterium]
MNVVIVESPAKAKTINKYLGDDYLVVASYGHVRDLPAKDGSVRPDDDFAMLWQLDSDAEKRIAGIVKAVKGAARLYLATDPDREGEAISWHVQQVLAEKRALKGVEVKRITFNEITRSAVLEALRNPRDVNQELVDAYLARRALDYLVGFSLSPVLWRKLPGARSAGRVQSVALRLVCEREAEIEAFTPQEYWTIDVACATAAGLPFSARLTQLDGRRIGRLTIADRSAAEAAVAAIEAAQGWRVGEIETKSVKRHPQPPFTTSTLQQEASRKLGLSASRTMQLAQRLYEGVEVGGETVGLITYMRTDGVTLSGEAIGAIRRLILADHGQRYLPDKPRAYKSPAKNAQEAHEAIRPTDFSRRPQQLARVLDADQLRLYELIWKRAVASQMESAVLDQTGADIRPEDAAITLRATGSVVAFDGFLAVYQEGRDDDADEENRLLPRMAVGEAVSRGAVKPEQHFTQPPPRYSEASLVKRLEELGIGRPSTYASILQVLQDREYVRLEKRRFVPEDRGRIVTAFLSNFFRRYVEYGFTADLETRLDEVSDGRIDWKALLREFWRDFHAAVADTSGLTIKQVIAALDQELGPHFFPERLGGGPPRACPACHTGSLSLKLGKFGAFIGCSNYPECRYTRRLGVDGDEQGQEAAGPRVLGEDPAGQPVSLRKGPYGWYVQLGEGDKPKRVSLTKDMAPDAVTLERALALLSLPRPLGSDPNTGEEILAGIGRFGPYLKRGSLYKNLPAGEDVLTIGMNRAVELLATAGRREAAPARNLGAHPADGKPVTLHSGRYGPYVQHGEVRANLPRGSTEASLEEAVALIAARAGMPAKGKTAKAKSARGKTAKGRAASKPAARAKPASTKAKAPTKAKPAARKPAAKTPT